ncbi:LpqB family beta-propeller domain-containing protein [Microbacterium sp. YY-01]|uniref:LpqB family beta-propeller domain-containing protein n=1 Tax=Microbacterium sp. YY-01 TaxID=3421634 RepID=UPI003D16F2F4
MTARASVRPLARARRVAARMLMLLAAVSLAVACASLPVSGDVRPGLSANETRSGADRVWVVDGPVEGADPERIVQGFIDAAVSPADNWAIAREFLTADFAEAWKPLAAVTVDTAVGDRRFTDTDPDAGDSADTAGVRLELTQTAAVDDAGVYSAVSGADRSAEVFFELERDDNDQWRIAQAPDGILLDIQAFSSGDIVSAYALQYFDATWTHLVPDVRWLPKRKNTPTRIVQELVAGDPAAWLATSVRTAFPEDVGLAKDSVLVEGQVAHVELTASALTLDGTTLARMRTQMERSLISAGVLEVQMTVRGSELDAGLATVKEATVDNRALVLTDDQFGYVIGGDITEIPGLSDQIVNFEEPLSSVIVQSDQSQAVVQTDEGTVYLVGQGRIDEVDDRPGLIAPTVDPFGYIWTVPAYDPTAMTAWNPVLSPTDVNAFTDASAVTHMAVSPDGARVAAVITVGTIHQVVVAGVLRDERNAPIGLGPATTVATLVDPAVDLMWRDATSLGVLTRSADEVGALLSLPVGGPGAALGVPDGAVRVAAGSPATAVRLLGENGTLWLRSGPIWQSESTGIRLLGQSLLDG